ncbi:MAG: hypothetical protein Q7S79_02775 [bacterium]|nr:hypothetical protein [bacterium]
MFKFFTVLVTCYCIAASFAYLLLVGVVAAQEATPGQAAPTNSPTPEPVQDPSGGSRGSGLFFSQESLQNTLPSGLQGELMPQGSQTELELKGSKLRKYTNLPNKLAVETDKDEPRPPGNVFEVILGWFQKLFLPRTVKKAGFVQFTRPNDLAFTNQSDPKDQESSNKEVYEGAVIDTERFFTPEGISPSRYPVSFPSSAISIQSTKLKEIFKDAADSQCVPIGVLLAISRRELDKTFTYSDLEVDKFSTNDWQDNLRADDPDVQRSSCYNTCLFVKGCLPGDDVRGPMQFEIKTWNGHIAQIKSALQTKYGVPDNYIPNRCNLRDAVVGAAVKMKGNSGTLADQCSGWSDQTVKNVAEGYCGKGACSGAIACGINYCDSVVDLYHKYTPADAI